MANYGVNWIRNAPPSSRSTKWSIPLIYTQTAPYSYISSPTFWFGLRMRSFAPLSSPLFPSLPWTQRRF